MGVSFGEIYLRAHTCFSAGVGYVALEHGSAFRYDLGLVVCNTGMIVSKGSHQTNKRQDWYYTLS